MTDEPHGLARGLTNYGDRDFARFLRRSFARSMGLSTEMLNKPVIGIAMTPSGFNNCHRGMDDLVEAVSRGVLAAGAPQLQHVFQHIGAVTDNRNVDLDVLDAFDRLDFRLHRLLEHWTHRTHRRGQRHDDVDVLALRAFDVDVVDQA